MPLVHRTRASSPPHAAAAAPPVAVSSRSPAGVCGHGRVGDPVGTPITPAVRTLRRRNAPTPAMNDARIRQENMAMRQRLLDVKPRAFGLANAVCTATNRNGDDANGSTTRRLKTPTPAPMPAPMRTRPQQVSPPQAPRRMDAVNRITRNSPPRVNWRQVAATPNVNAQHNNSNHGQTQRTSRPSPPARDVGHPNRIVNAQTNGNADGNANGNVNRITQRTAPVIHENAVQERNRRRAEPTRPSAAITRTAGLARTRGLLPSRVPAQAQTPARARVHARAQVPLPAPVLAQAPAQTPATTRRVRLNTQDTALSPAEGQAPSAPPTRIPRPKRHVTPAPNDPTIKRANLELRRRIEEAKASAKTKTNTTVIAAATSASLLSGDAPPQAPAPDEAIAPQTSHATTAPLTDSRSSPSLESPLESPLEFPVEMPVEPLSFLVQEGALETPEDASASSSHSEPVPRVEATTAVEGDSVVEDAPVIAAAPVIEDAFVVQDIPAVEETTAGVDILAVPSVSHPSVPIQLTLNDIVFSRKPIGEGGFGSVFLASVDPIIESFRNIWGHEERVNSDPSNVALLALNEMLPDREEKDDRDVANPARAEKASLVAIGPHPMIINAYAAFDGEETRSSYLLMEYASLGDLHDLCANHRPDHRVEEAILRDLAAGILLGVQHIHAAGFVHRDLKPANVVLGNDGRPKIIDFGFATKLEPGERTTEWCGTLSYMAPEILISNECDGRSNNDTSSEQEMKHRLSRAYDRAVDLWAFGILLYEMLVGYTPFRVYMGDSERAGQRTVREIIKYGFGYVELSFPEDISANARNLIQGLLARDPNSRLGMCSDDEVRRHPWFRGINWVELLGENPVSMAWQELLRKAEATSARTSSEGTAESSSSLSCIFV